MQRHPFLDRDWLDDHAREQTPDSIRAANLARRDAAKARFDADARTAWRLRAIAAGIINNDDTRANRVLEHA